MDAKTRNLVRSRAAGRCEYCGMRQEDEPIYRLHIEHVIAKQHEGGDEAENLAAACFHCNLHKGPNLSAIDPESRRLVPLFNPRCQFWGEHFQIRGAIVVGLTPTGRATARLLKMNEPARLTLRRHGHSG